MPSHPAQWDPLVERSIIDSDWASNSESLHTEGHDLYRTQSLPDMLSKSVTRYLLGSGRISPVTTSSSTTVTTGHRPLQPRASPESPNIYHPADSPAEHGRWVMWVGNISRGVKTTELESIFNTCPAGHTPDPDADNQVLTINMVDYTKCCFVSFRTRYALEKAVARFHNVTLRPEDSSALRLVCRIRTEEDTLKAGVNSQRNTGIHLKWVRDKNKKLDRSKSAPSLAYPTLSPWKGPSPDESSVSIETTSSFLHEHFPIRYFIMKSITEAALETSVREGSWTTQTHNEGLLDQAFRTSQTVYLIFSVNKSGQFYGYAKLTSGKLPAASAPLSEGQSHFREPESGPSRLSSTPPETITTAETERAGILYFYPSPSSNSVTAPSKMETTRRPRTTVLPPHTGEGTWTSATGSLGSALVVPKSPLPVPEPPAPTMDPDQSVAQGIIAPSSNYRFNIEWLSLDRVSFRQTRTYRNPWNHGREIKVSRDGTELEPETGERLIKNWETLSAAG